MQNGKTPLMEAFLYGYATLFLMYDTFMSKQWLFDRCLEGSSTYVSGLFYILVLSICITVLGYFLFRRKKFKKTRILIFILSIVALIPSLYVGLVCIAMYVGFFVMNCSFGAQFWTSIEAGHILQSKINQQYAQTGEYPHSLDEVQSLSPSVYKTFIQNAKVQYYYDKDQGSYYLFVRPSRYAVFLFDQEKGYALYNLSPLVLTDSGPNAQLYPPHYPGPWDQLPQ